MIEKQPKVNKNEEKNNPHLKIPLKQDLKRINICNLITEDKKEDRCKTYTITSDAKTIQYLKG